MTDNSLWTLPIDPREVQLEALNKGFGKDGFAYFLRQRLGKTWLSYAEFVKLRDQDEVDWFLLICPNSLKEQWREAIETVDEFTPIHIYSANRKDAMERFFNINKSGGVFIINYESVKAFMANNGWEKLHLLRTYIVADESTKIKESTAKSTKACLELAKLCRYRRVLTGKPKANSNKDLWAQLKFIGATHRTFPQHRDYFCAQGGWMGKQVVRDMNTHILQREMEPISYIAPDKYLRGFEKIYEPLRRVHLRGEQLKQYKDMQDDFLVKLSDGTKITASIALVQYLRLQQIASGLAGDPDHTQHNLVDPDHNPRIRVLQDIIENEIENKVIIVCRFRLSIDNIVKVLRRKYKVVTLVGNMTGEQIEANKLAFNEFDTQILVAQTQVLSYGHTLCGNKDNPCDSMIFYENDFSLINRAQCESRPEHADWDIPISYYDMYASKMDRYIMECLRRKEDASLALMGYARDKGFRPTMVDAPEEYKPIIEIVEEEETQEEDC